jgi:hypothetical protein
MLKPWEIDRRTGTSYKKKTGTTDRSTQSAALSRFKDQVGLEAPGIPTDAAGMTNWLQSIDNTYAKQKAAANNSSGGGQSGGGNATQDALAALLSQPAAPAAPAAEPAPYVDPYADARAEAQRAAEARRQFLQQWASGARMTMNQASDNAAAMLAAQVNPYEQIQMIAPSIAPSVYETYLQQAGVSPEQVQALISVSAAEQAANDQAYQNMLDVLAGSTNVARDSRISDVELARALGGLDVDNRLMASMLGVDEGEAAALAKFAELTRQDQLAADDRAYSREQDSRQERLNRVNSIVSAIGDQLDPTTILEMYAQAGA